MEHRGIYMALIILSVVTVVCFGAELEAKTLDPKPKIEENNNSLVKESINVKQTGTRPFLVDQKGNTDDPQSASKDGTKNVASTNSLSKELNSKEVPNVDTDKDHSGDKSHVKDGNKKEGGSDRSESKVVPKGVATEGTSLPLKPPQVEECDSSIKCNDEKNKLIACLRFPGNDSPVSLLIQNKGTNALTVKISAPDYVHLENNSVHLPVNEDKMVKVSIGEGNKNTLIILTARGSKCSIDFRNLILHNSEEKANDTAKSTFVGIISKVPSFVFISIVALMVVVSAWMCVRFRQKHVTSESTKYQKLETELPFSGGGKKETDEEDGWDENWGDSWDDEEAPKTPSMPITPSLSSKGLASRKLSKDA